MVAVFGVDFVDQRTCFGCTGGFPIGVAMEFFEVSRHRITDMRDFVREAFG